MPILKGLLAISTFGIYALTLIAMAGEGINWPAVALSDLLMLNWRTQFNMDFIVHLLLCAAWIAWRERLTAKAWSFAFLSIVMGGMFTFPYLLYAIREAKGDTRRILLGKQSPGNPA